MTRYDELQASAVRATIEALQARIGERFPGSGLGQVAAQLRRVADRNEVVVERLRHPHWPIRILTATTIGSSPAYLDVCPSARPRGWRDAPGPSSGSAG